jgi:hypothetical protein
MPRAVPFEKKAIWPGGNDVVVAAERCAVRAMGSKAYTGFGDAPRVRVVGVALMVTETRLHALAE